MKLVALLVLAMALPAEAQTTPKPAANLDAAYFTQKVQPILERRCVGCHGAETLLSHFDLRSRESTLKGGTRGAAIVPGNAAKSLMHVLMTGSRAPLMPPSGKLPASEIVTLKTWIDGGAPWGATTSLASAQKQTWWSFAPFSPAGRGQGGVDTFIIAKLQENKLSLSPTRLKACADPPGLRRSLGTAPCPRSGRGVCPRHRPTRLREAH